jgi:hypothetical protein
MAWSMRKYTNGDEIKSKIKAYFADCETKTAENLANKIKWLEIPTVAGLALALDITTETLRNYLKDESYKDVQWEVAKAYMHFRDKYEQGAMNTGNLAFLRILATIFPEIYTEKQTVEQDEYKPFAVTIKDKQLKCEEKAEEISPSTKVDL